MLTSEALIPLQVIDLSMEVHILRLQSQYSSVVLSGRVRVGVRVSVRGSVGSTLELRRLLPRRFLISASCSSM